MLNHRITLITKDRRLFADLLPMKFISQERFRTCPDPFDRCASRLQGLHQGVHRNPWPGSNIVQPIPSFRSSFLLQALHIGETLLFLSPFLGIRVLRKYLRCITPVFLQKFTFRPPPLNFSLNLVDLVILAFLDGDYFYK